MPYIHSLKKKVLVGAGVGLWLFAFLLFIAPFDASDLTFKIRVLIMVVYGLIFFLGYLIIIYFEWLVFSRLKYWSLRWEITMYFSLYSVVFIPTIFYYKSEIVNGDYAEFQFFLEQYIPTLIIVTPVIYLFRRIASKTDEGLVTIKGDNKRDILRIATNNVISVSSSDNYIEVAYFKNGVISKRLLRTTLKKIESELLFLKRIHRSHLINIEHFIEWQGKDTVVVGGVVLPVSKKYRENVPD